MSTLRAVTNRVSRFSGFRACARKFIGALGRSGNIQGLPATAALDGRAMRAAILSRLWYEAKRRSRISADNPSTSISGTEQAGSAQSSRDHQTRVAVSVTAGTRASPPRRRRPPGMAQTPADKETPLARRKAEAVRSPAADYGPASSARDQLIPQRDRLPAGCGGGMVSGPAQD